MGGVTVWKAWGGGWDWCEHKHATWEDATACAAATHRAAVVDMSTAVIRPDGSFEFSALNREMYASGGETVDLSAFFPKPGR